MGTNAGSAVIIVTGISFCVTTLTVLLRYYVRLHYRKRLFADDYLVLFSQAAFIVSAVCAIKMVQYGVGRHLMDILTDDPMALLTTFPKMLKYIWVAQIFYILTNCSVKISVAVYFCSLHPPRYLRIGAIITACMTIVFGGILFEIYLLFECRPLSDFWNVLNPDSKGRCLSANTSYALLQTLNIVNIITDVSLTALPSIMVWNMNLRPRQKVAISVLLGAAGLACIASIARAICLKPVLTDPKDFTWHEMPLCLTSVLEPAIAIAVVSAAQLKPLVKDIFPKRSTLQPSPGNIVTVGRQGNARSNGFSEITFDDLESTELHEHAGNTQKPAPIYSLKG